jgi:hypothetical protein
MSKETAAFTWHLVHALLAVLGLAWSAYFLRRRERT